MPALLLFLPSLPAFAADIDGASLGSAWALPFAGMLLSIALLPMLARAFWHHHYGKVALGWAALFLLPFATVHGPGAALAGLVHALVAEYIPFITLIAALFVTAGGICVRGNLHGTPALNTGILALGMVLASLMGTTGAAMLLVRPLIRANDNRRHAVHIFVFFIFLVANIGGSLTPLGDPPLFLGFLQGVEFSWTLKALWRETLFSAVLLLAAFYALDSYYFHQREEERPLYMDPSPDAPVWFEGKFNFVLIAAVIGLVLLSGVWKPGVSWDLLGTPVALQDLVRDLGLLAVIGLSLRFTIAEVRAGNEFDWEPMREVAKLFIGIFLTIIPVIAMLRAGADGAFAAVAHMVNDAAGRPVDAMYFWATGLLSAFLDNAPTYLVFFNMAGGGAQRLMGEAAGTLAAISCGAVFMGAMSYIGNAPNLMVKAIAEHRGVRMPGFFGYLGWSCCILLPLFLILTLVFFRG
ncbi:MAG: sodium:proton antiporter [Candidatus Protistobacter heckmanni]|nr:sodium:proton antiporter [Candidatus Protistobacter heckmanni]